MAVFSPGFRGRRRSTNPGLPPGQYEEQGFPVLTAGPTQRIRLDDWRLTLSVGADEQRTWNWDELMALSPERIDTDLHCAASRWTGCWRAWRPTRPT